MTPAPNPDTPSNQSRDDATGLRLYTADQAAALLQVSPAWLRKKATARQIPATFIGRYLRFSAHDIITIQRAGARPAAPRRTTFEPGTRP